MREAPLISILLTCYNQQAFVEKAVDSIIYQNIRERFEVVVADDGSTDQTRARAVMRLRGRPDIIVNLVSDISHVGATRNFFRGVKSCKAQFVAVIEGDDYWIHKDKITLQKDVLVRHPECTACGHNFYIFDEAINESRPRAIVSDLIEFFNPEDLIRDNLPGNMSASMYRRAALDRLPPEICEARCGDWLLNICAASTGPLAFMHRPMSVYRRTTAGMWSGISRAEQLTQLLDLIPEYDRLTNGCHNEAFCKLATTYRAELANLLTEAPRTVSEAMS